MINLDLGVQWVKITQSWNLNNLGSTLIHNATYQVLRSSIYCFWRKFLRFLPYVGVVAMFISWPWLFENFYFPLFPSASPPPPPPPHSQPRTPCSYKWNLVTIGPVVSEETSFETVDGQRQSLWVRCQRWKPLKIWQKIYFKWHNLGKRYQNLTS